MDGEELSSEDIAQGWPHYEGGLEDGDVDGRVVEADALLHEGDAEGDERRGPGPV